MPVPEAAAPQLGLHYSLQTDDGDAGPLVEEALAQIARADADGFSSAVFAEHHFMEDGWLPRPMLLAAAAAAVTKRMLVGTNILILPLHHPVAVAEEAAVLDIVSGGRAVLGVGLGWIRSEFAGFGVPFGRRAAVYEESLTQLQALLSGATVDGTNHHRFERARITPLPAAGRIPIRIGAVNERGVRRAARLADAWVMPPGAAIPRLRELKELFDAERAAAGLTPAAEQPLRREVFIAESEARAWELVAPGVRYEYGQVYRSTQPTYPENDTVDRLRAWGEGRVIVGTVDSVAEQLTDAAHACRASEVLVRWRFPGVDAGAASECFEGLREVLARLRA
jgi:alkanesulfonate monooxygenase SsuD/methylene tetrahydromethanopterin reductase-like flavin-dependent oxidoreductase (luciferase family)